MNQEETETVIRELGKTVQEMRKEIDDLKKKVYGVKSFKEMGC